MIFTKICMLVVSIITISISPKEDIELTFLFSIQESDSLLITDISDAAVTKNGEIVFLSYRQNQAFIFDRQGEFLFSVGGEGRGPGEFNGPGRIAAGPEGNIYIYDGRNARLTVWDSNFEYITDIPVVPGWNTHFKTNTNSLYLFSKPHRRTTNGNSIVVISEVDKMSRSLTPVVEYEIENWNEDLPLATWSQWDISDDMKIVASGNIDDSKLRILDMEGNVMDTFGGDSDQVFFSEEEMQARVDAAARIDPEFAAIRASGRDYKHIFTNIEICKRGYIWAHRNKPFGAREEIDIYSINGERKTMVTLPASENSYHMLGIYGDKVLFRVTDLEGLHKLFVYQIEYG